MLGTALFRFQRHYGWQVFDWIPSNRTNSTRALIIRDAKGDASLLRLSGKFIHPVRKGKFCKRPHKLMCLKNDAGS